MRSQSDGVLAAAGASQQQEDSLLPPLAGHVNTDPVSRFRLSGDDAEAAPAAASLETPSIFKQLLLSVASEAEAAAKELRQLRGPAYRAELAEEGQSSSPWTAERLRKASLQTEPQLPGLSEETADVAEAQDIHLHLTFRERLSYCAAQYQKLDEENQRLSSIVARKSSEKAEAGSLGGTVDLHAGRSPNGVAPLPFPQPGARLLQSLNTPETASSIATDAPAPAVAVAPSPFHDTNVSSDAAGLMVTDRSSTFDCLGKEGQALPVSNCWAGDEAKPSELQLAAKAGSTERPPEVFVAPPGRSSARLSVVVSVAEQHRACYRARLELLASAFLESKWYGIMMMVSVIFALFASGLWIIADIPDDPGNDILVVCLVLVTIFFAVEILLNAVVQPGHYLWSFFFWMDFLGTLSVMFEIGWLSAEGSSTQGSADSVLLRTARAAKLGTRIGRLFKVMKCLSVFMKCQEFRQQKSLPTSTCHDMEAKVISQRLALVLSTRISCLVIALMLFVPFTQIGLYPEADLSMRSWAQRLELEYARAYEELSSNSSASTSTVFEVAVSDMISFYDELEYMPYRLDGYDEEIVVDGRACRITGSSLLDNVRAPVRSSNSVEVNTLTCRVDRSACEGGSQPTIYFDFGTPNGLEVVSDLILISTMILTMILVSFDLNRVLGVMLVKPMERMLGVLHKYASSILDQVLAANRLTATPEGHQLRIDTGGVAETDLLEDLMRKLAHVAQLSTQLSEEHDLDTMDDEGKGVIMEMMLVKPARRKTTEDMASAASSRSIAGIPSGIKGLASGRVGHTGSNMGRGDSKQSASERTSKLTVSEELVNSWELDVLGLDSPSLSELVMYMFFDSAIGVDVGISTLVPPGTLRRFNAAVEKGYMDLPYHCYVHACDVLHTVYRTLNLVQSRRWLSDVDQYAIMVAALCHDVGHTGRTNAFLVETRHELALRYNDNSPLENMHCARLFELASNETLDVFGNLDVQGRKQARKVCIAAILHTDNIHHMDMVRDISTIYEVNSETCEAAALAKSEGYARYLQDVMRKDSLKWLQLFLHLADVSNPLKPFRISKAWAARVVAEFFEQGDEEKRLQLPVGMLNDRDKVTLPGSQHGFINFMVTPLVVSTVRLFPTLHPLTTQMADNLQQWRDLWVAEAHPAAAEKAKRDEEVAKVAAIAEELVVRTLDPNVPRGRMHQSSSSGSSYRTTRSSQS